MWHICQNGNHLRYHYAVKPLLKKIPVRIEATFLKYEKVKKKVQSVLLDNIQRGGIFSARYCMIVHLWYLDVMVLKKIESDS